jgi:putative heme-binding domain-containing protein
MNLRFLSALLLIAPAWVVAQDAHTAQQAKAAAEAEAAAAASSPREAGATPDLKALITDPAALEKGRKLFMTQCIDCHGPKGEGSRGPNLAQPNLPRAGDDASLIRILRSGIAGTEMPAARLKPGEAPYLAAYVRSLGMIPVEKVTGDPVKGGELFRTKGACLTCHAVNGQGMTIGPELTDIGRRRGAAFLRRALVEPGAEVPQNFIAYRTDISLPVNFLFIRAKTKDGKEVAGVRVNEDAFTIQVRDLTGFVHSFEKSDLAELHKDKGVSPMPVYAGVFTPTELDDVIAYLVSLKGQK